jgi:LmbE family N-acetylglucosaminyl deacetylase
MTSPFTLLTLLVCGATVGVLGAGRNLARRVRRPVLLRSVALAAAAVLVPLDVSAALADAPPGGLGQPLAAVVIVVNLVVLSTLAALVLANWIRRVPVTIPRRVLALGAHPDDIELGCGATLAKLYDSGHEVHALVMSHGERGGDARNRPGEARRGATFVGLTSVQVLDLPDRQLADSMMEMVDAIEHTIHRLNPDIILTHSRNDLHQDHRAVHEASLRAARRHSAILCYESPSVTDAFQPSFFIDVEDYVDVKVTAVGLHRDQRNKPYMTPERVRGLAVYRGAQAKTRAAEAFEPVRLLGSQVGVL